MAHCNAHSYSKCSSIQKYFRGAKYYIIPGFQVKTGTRTTLTTQEIHKQGIREKVFTFKK